jgi:carboxynorspermidine decarboxylase
MFAVYPMISKYLDGTTASGLFEAKLGREEFAGEVHTFCPAYKDSEFDEIARISDHIVFNSFAKASAICFLRQ